MKMFFLLHFQYAYCLFLGFVEGDVCYTFGQLPFAELGKFLFLTCFSVYFLK